MAELRYNANFKVSTHRIVLLRASVNITLVKFVNCFRSFIFQKYIIFLLFCVYMITSKYTVGISYQIEKKMFTQRETMHQICLK